LDRDGAFEERHPLAYDRIGDKTNAGQLDVHGGVP
jgi:hypothetical protein